MQTLLTRLVPVLALVASLGACGDADDGGTDAGSDATVATTATTVAPTVTTTAAGVSTSTTGAGRDPRDPKLYRTFTEVKADPGGEPVSRTGSLSGDQRDGYVMEVTAGAGERVYGKVTGSKGEGLLLALYSPTNVKLQDGVAKFDVQVDDSGKYLITVRTAALRSETTSYTVEMGVSVPAG